MRVKVCYRVQLTPEDYKTLVEIGREHGHGFENAKPLKIVKRLLQTSGDGILASIDDFRKRKEQ